MGPFKSNVLLWCNYSGVVWMTGSVPCTVTPGPPITRGPIPQALITILHHLVADITRDPFLPEIEDTGEALIQGLLMVQEAGALAPLVIGVGAALTPVVTPDEKIWSMQSRDQDLEKP
ncbi:OLC1v1033896C1 [Oldenlandia corymbosa var. corymbosa]|uniref:OLC1v1033896C1 n=1 Tax=Oldenlandia corymbosa var. corymbosa TaxID=529605 RepID=A0AAV1CQP6_OLDCO|nr:OLC1v1033896C1 [Oldenlandia corymbosa var. corymbosa]